MSGTQDVVVGGGVEVMSIVPIGASIKDGYEAGHGLPFDSDGIKRIIQEYSFLNSLVQS